MKTYHNHCTEELSNEAKRVIGTKNWSPVYKSQLMSRVEDMLEGGQMVRTKTGGRSTPFKISDVEEIVNVVSDRD
jgi:hypothetical protein